MVLAMDKKIKSNFPKENYIDGPSNLLQEKTKTLLRIFRNFIVKEFKNESTKLLML